MAGCQDVGGRIGDDTRVSGPGWRTLRLPNTNQDVAFDAAVHAVKQWFLLEEAARDAGVVRSRVVEYSQQGGTGHLRDATPFQNRMRRCAVVVIRPTAGGCTAHCRVSRERLDTADHRALYSNVEFDDRPSTTPIDREAGVRSDQQEAWTRVGPDLELAGQILDVMANRLFGPFPEEPAAKPDS